MTIVIDDGVTEKTSSEIIENVWACGQEEPEYQSAFSLAGGQIVRFDPGMDIEQISGSANKLNIGCLSKPGYCFSPDEKTENIYEAMKFNPCITEFTVVENYAAIGFMTRTQLNERLGGRYGFTLFSQNPIREIMNTGFLKLNCHISVEQASKLAMQRPFERLYNPIVVEREGNYMGIVTVKDLLDTCTKIARAERDEITVMKDSLKIGLFFMDRDNVIQDHYSRYLEEMLSEKDLFGKSFLNLLSASFSAKELTGIHDYFNMVFQHEYDQDMLDELNPLNEFEYVNANTGGRKVFQCDFTTIEQARGEAFTLVTMYDVTAETELQRQLAEEEGRRQEEMKNIFELLQVEPQVFNDFLEDAEYEFSKINETLKNETLPADAALVEIYQSVHAVKSNAVILGLGTFGEKAHKLETIIKKLREQNEAAFNDILNLNMDIDRLLTELNRFKTIIEKLHSFKSSKNDKRQGIRVLVESLTKTVDKVSADMGKKIKFVTDEVDVQALEKGPRRIIKETLMQLARNSAVHGIEAPEDRTAKGKNETGVIRLSIKANNGTIHIKLSDDGHGLDYGKIAEKALLLNLIKPEYANNKNTLLKVIFSPGFSTAETEGIHAGRGIGLSLVQDRVRLMKGSVKVRSEIGKGTEFNLLFPVSIA
jgi:two-component system chemotaxis sensor kinase CheA